MPRTALVSIDLQQDYLDRPGLIPDAATLIASCAALLTHAREQGWLVVHVRTLADGSVVMPHRRARPEVRAGTPGAEPPPELVAFADEPVLLKRFFDPFDDPAFEALLREQGAEQLVLMGVHGHACVRSTATSAYARGFEVAIAEEAVGSDDPLHSELALRWLDQRTMARRDHRSLGVQRPTVGSFRHADPTDTRRILFEVEADLPDHVERTAEQLDKAQPSLAALSAGDHSALLRRWHSTLAEHRDDWVEAIVRDVAKPRRDAEAEVAYGLALLANSAGTVENEPGPANAAYRPHGVVGLITPWNNPFALPIGKIAPALSFGNAALWKPALPGARIARMLVDSLEAAGLGQWIGLAQGGASIGRVVASHHAVRAVSITGSIPAGRQMIELGGLRRIPVQAELGGNNAAIVDESCEIDAAAADLALSMFSFSGQRCTAIRRVIVLDAVYDRFIERLVEANEALTLGMPADAATIIGPVLAAQKKADLASKIAAAEQSGARLLCGGQADSVFDQGSWLAPAILDRIDPADPLVAEEQFGPVAVVSKASSFDQAIAHHNHGDLGLLGALFSTDKARIESFLANAEAGILSIGRARPAFSDAGPFVGWKDSGFGPPEHGRWNRDTYARPQAIYRRE